MSDVSARGALPAPSSPSAASKAARARLIRLGVEADPCPQVMMRVLGLLAQQSLIPLTIAASSTPESIRVEIELDGGILSEARAERLVHKLAAIVTVRDARVMRS
jgi:hypothetical protein